ncbi:MAG TPA: c-type cytochrome domain-containing protein [Verrucomicrobiae bacterium]|nr:c-type cytochrome domain-containing protein [Verrucomicrobiae bacterium]
MIEFIGKFHPLFVHLPIGFLVLLGIFEALATRSPKQHLTESSRVVLVLTFPITIASVVTGWLLAGSGDYEGSNIFWHRWLGTGLGVATGLLLGLHWSGLYRLYRWGLIGTLGLLVAASHLGGSLTHGSDFLSWPAPALSRNKPPFTGDISAQPVYTAAIEPIFAKYCVSCHGPEKSKGGLRMDRLEHFTKGGDSGSPMAPAGATESLLGKRLALPLDDDEHMPPDGKPQLSKDQLAIIHWWLNAGAPTDKKIQDLNPTPEILKALQAPTSSSTQDAPQ